MTFQLPATFPPSALERMRMAAWEPHVVRVCVQYVWVCMDVYTVQVLLHLSQWDFTVNIKVCVNSASITQRHHVINEFPEFEFSGENEIC